MESKSQSECSSDFDEDTCLPEEIDKLFKHKYKIHDETSVTYEDSYVLSLAKDECVQKIESFYQLISKYLTFSSFTCVAAGLSNGSVRLFEINSEKGVYIEPPDKTLNICGLRFLDETPNLLLVGTSNGLVRLVDLRVKGEVCRYVNRPRDAQDPRDILCFDRNSSGQLLVMGTEQKRDNVYLLAYDLRTSNELFRYEDSHQNDITTLCFHPNFPDILCSGSTDGLINIFDLQTTDESDAILMTINTESSVQKVHWHKHQDEKHIVSCTTDTNCFKAYNFDGDVVADFDRLKITESVKRRNEVNCNLINCHSTVDNNIILIAGTNNDNGSVLRSCKFQNGQLFPHANFDGNKQIVRESIFDSRTNILITAGEGGFVTLWTPLDWEFPVSSTNNSDYKMKTKKSNKVTPY